MTVHWSKSQVDRLGDRLRRETYGAEDLRLLDEYRRTFGGAYDKVVEAVQRVLGVPVSGRPAKSTTSIIEKLKRESIRLSQMQDIAGCRAVVADISEQESGISAVKNAFRDVSVVDRRIKPSHGYRAVHFILHDGEKPIEVQLRTRLQHAWAEMCEKCADVFDPAIKYGGGPSVARVFLDDASIDFAEAESAESGLIRVGAAESEVGRELREARESLLAKWQSAIVEVSNIKRGRS